ncbi:MAG: helix-turn-helix domain-containing protein [Microcystaceae cyanobacterium]
MTLTFNPESYAALLVKYQPKAIATEEEHETALALAQELEHRPNRTPEEEALLELLVILIEKFESEHYPIPERTPHAILVHLMEANKIKQQDLVGVIGSRKVVSEVVNSERNLSQAQAQALAKFFSVDISLFV